MPSFDIMSEVDQPSLRNSVEVANSKIAGRHDFKGTSARLELGEKLITMYGDSDFQLDQMKAILLPEMTKKKVDVRCLDYGDVQKISGNKVKQEVKVRVGVDHSRRHRGRRVSNQRLAAATRSRCASVPSTGSVGTETIARSAPASA